MKRYSLIKTSDDMSWYSDYNKRQYEMQEAFPPREQMEA